MLSDAPAAGTGFPGASALGLFLFFPFGSFFGFYVDFFGQLVELLIGLFFLIQSLLQQIGSFVLAQQLSPRTDSAVRQFRSVRLFGLRL